MPKIFCLKCNGATEYTSSKPNFCSKCGKPYIDTINVSKASEPTKEQPEKITKPKFSISTNINFNNRQNNQIIKVTDDDIENDSQFAPKIDKIDVNILSDNLRPNRESSEQVLLQGFRGEQVLLKGGKSAKNDITPRIKRKVSKKQEKLDKIQAVNDFKKIMTSGRNIHHSESTEIE